MGILIMGHIKIGPVKPTLSVRYNGPEHISLRIGALRGHILHAGQNDIHLHMFREGKECFGIVGITSRRTSLIN
jgi:hypothetical protein